MQPPKAGAGEKKQTKASATATAAAFRESFMEALTGLVQNEEMHQVIRFEGGVLSVFSKARVLEALGTRFASYDGFARQLNYYHFKLVKPSSARTTRDWAQYVLGPELCVPRYAHLLQAWPDPVPRGYAATVLRSLPRKIKPGRSGRSNKGRGTSKEEDAKLLLQFSEQSFRKATATNC